MRVISCSILQVLPQNLVHIFLKYMSSIPTHKILQKLYVQDSPKMCLSEHYAAAVIVNTCLGAPKICTLHLIGYI